MTEQPSGRLNLRFWDLIDLILLEDLLDEDLSPLREAAISIFAARGTHAWPPELIVPAAWRAPYTASAVEIEAGLLPAALRRRRASQRGSRRALERRAREMS